MSNVYTQKSFNPYSGGRRHVSARSVYDQSRLLLSAWCLALAARLCGSSHCGVYHRFYPEVLPKHAFLNIMKNPVKNARKTATMTLCKMNGGW